MLQDILFNIHLDHYRWQFLTRLVEKCILSKGCQESVWLFSGQRLIQKTVGEMGCLPEQDGHGGEPNSTFISKVRGRKAVHLRRTVRKICEKGTVGAGRQRQESASGI